MYGVLGTQTWGHRKDSNRRQIHLVWALVFKKRINILKFGGTHQQLFHLLMVPGFSVGKK